MIKTSGFARKSLTLGVSSAALLAALALPAAAQTAPGSAQDLPAPADSQTQTPGTVAIKDQNAQNTALSTSQDQAQAEGGDVVVTGSLFRRTNTETPSPVTVLTSAQLEQRGINTVTEAIQRLSANGAGTLPNSFSGNGAFASGASAPSLRGLTTDSTLVLFDGLRAAYYPLADDGTRNFVDINSIPDAIVDRIEVLKDGASSTYGADAVAGVVNIITKKQITGIHLNGSAGISQRGDAPEQRIDGTFGYGDLTENHFNVYVSGEYQHDGVLYNRDRGYPYNTADLSHLCAPSVGTTNPTTGAVVIPAGTTTCRTNSIQNGVNFDGTYGGTGTTVFPVVRPYNASNTAAIAGSRYQLLNPAAGCGNLPTVALNAAQATANPSSALLNCQQDNRYLYNTITPTQDRIGGSARLTVQINEKTQAYLALNFYRSDVYYTGVPTSFRSSAPVQTSGAQFSLSSLALPVYVCPLNGANATLVNSVPTRTGGCTAANGGTLNPNNPFNQLGQAARVVGYLNGVQLSNERKTDTYRAAGGITGSAGDLFDYRVEGTYMKEHLRATYNGYIYLQNLVNSIADGSYNFVDQTANSQAIRNYVAPSFVNLSDSELYQIQATGTKALFTLPGGPLNVAVGGAYRHESVYSPSANPVVAGDTLGAQRYSSGINPFSTIGARGVASGFFEIDAPIVTQLEVNGSGRYDSYSTGQSNFSPKIGAKFTPIKQLAIRGTWSRGFRIPSFAETTGSPTTGYINSQVTATTAGSAAAANAFINAHGGDAYATQAYSVGLASVPNPNLRPERSRNFTGGVVFEPIRNVSLSVDYFNITKRDVILATSAGDVIKQYYSNNGVVSIPGVTVAPQTADPNAPANALPLLGFIVAPFQNGARQLVSGLDFDLEASVRLTSGIKLQSSLEASYIMKYSLIRANGTYERYDGTLGPENNTSASGTPKWRGSWQNTLDFDNRYSLSLTAYYTSGYNESATDNSGVYQDCYNSLGGDVAVYRDGATPVVCDVKAFVNFDLSAQAKVSDKFTLYANVLNLFDVAAPYDPGTYGAYQYNPAWANAGIIGRYFRVGARVNF